jgi:ATP-dependent helicase/nuclease subunit B
MGPKLVTIAPNIAFLEALAAWWLHRAGPDPLAVADGIFIVPTRRAARSLADAFLSQSGGKPLLLPRILALGGFDETPLTLAGGLDSPPAVPPLRRLAVLTRFILAMGGQNGAPSRADRAWTLAVELASLLDEAARAELDLAAALPKAVGEDFAAHWNITLGFLEVVTKAWPAFLAEAGFADIGGRQRALLDAQSRAWQENPPGLPIIAAGTTGAIPAVSRLLKTVANLPQGLVVLPGLDLALDEESWLAVDDSHPQGSLRALLVALDARRADVRDWREFAGSRPADIAPPGRIATWRTALLPATSLGTWQNPPPLDAGGLEKVEPADQQEEAVAIALVLRDALDQPGRNAALVTPDRVLARRVTTELLRFGVVADDSAGEDLADTPPAVFLRLLAEAVAEDLRPVPLLALLKHPLCALGMEPGACRAAARRLERAVLRGPRPEAGLVGLRRDAGAAPFIDRLEHALSPLLKLRAAGEALPSTIVTTLLQAGEAVAATDILPGRERLWAGEEGQALATHLAELQEAIAILPQQDFATLPGMLGATLAGVAVHSRRALRGREGAEHPRVFIWGLLEARLQTVDVIVLGGLSEGVWPPLAESGPWMNRAMRKTIGLPSPEERIGLAAHDFVMASCAAPRALLCVPRRRDNAPAVPSRWMVRLDALLAGRGRTLHLHPASLWARALDLPAGAPKPVSPPAPTPPVAWRPRRLSVTEIETFLRDPYAIYARHVLRLKSLDPLEQSADAADYGSIVHDGLHRFFARNGLNWPADATDQLAADMEAALADANMRPALCAWWRPRLHRIALWVADAEGDRRAAGRPRLLCSEVKGEWQFAAPGGAFLLRGRADRIECRADGGMAILDYKTGTPPSTRQVEEGRSPQLPLEAAMVHAGAFEGIPPGRIAELTYWHISGGAEPGRALLLFGGDADKTASMAEQAASSVKALVADFDSPDRAYLSQPSPGAAPRFSDYVRLARVAEWAAVDDV